MSLFVQFKPVYYEKGNKIFELSNLFGSRLKPSEDAEDENSSDNETSSPEAARSPLSSAETKSCHLSEVGSACRRMLFEYQADTATDGTKAELRSQTELAGLGTNSIFLFLFCRNQLFISFCYLLFHTSGLRWRSGTPWPCGLGTLWWTTAPSAGTTSWICVLSARQIR